MKTPDEILLQQGFDVNFAKKYSPSTYDNIRRAMDGFAEQYAEWKLQKLSERNKSTETSDKHETKQLNILDVSKRLLSELRKHYLVNIDFDSGLPKADMKTIMQLWDEVNEYLGIKTV